MHLPGKASTGDTWRRIIDVEQSTAERRILQLHEALSRMIQSLIRVPALPALSNIAFWHITHNRAHRIVVGLARAATGAVVVFVCSSTSEFEFAMISEVSPSHKTLVGTGLIGNGRKSTETSCASIAIRRSEEYKGDTASMPQSSAEPQTSRTRTVISRWAQTRRRDSAE